MTREQDLARWFRTARANTIHKAPLERVTDRADIVEAGTESYRFRNKVKERRKRSAF